jgi:hypothetical protein
MNHDRCPTQLPTAEFALALADLARLRLAAALVDLLAPAGDRPGSGE